VTESDYDAIVVGGGLAGLAAAVDAAESGRRVLVVEAGDRLGGSSALSGGIIMAAGTSVQRAAGIEDSAEALCKDYLLFNQYGVDPALARRLCTDAADGIEWLIGHGIEFHRELVFAAEERVPRSHVPVRGGAGIVRALAKVLDADPRVDVALGQRIDRLLVEQDAVVGVAVGSDEVRAPATVLAMGGFGASRPLWRDHLPSLGAAGSAAWYIGADTARGDVFGLAAQVRAELVGHDRALILPTPNFSKALEVYFPGWLVMVDRAGVRRVDESSSYSVMDLTARRHGPLFAIFDDRAKHAAQPHLPPAYKQAVPGMDKATSANWVEPVLDEMVAQGRLAKAGTLEQLARALSIDADGLEASVRRYNESVALGEDQDFLKERRFLQPISDAPFYGCELRQGILALTMKGVRIDANARVLRSSGEPIAGLLAAGECVGGVLGDVYMGSGNSLASCLVFGRAAAASLELSADVAV
jgi:fumarate reductase flavoprotein subunit